MCDVESMRRHLTNGLSDMKFLDGMSSWKFQSMSRDLGFEEKPTSRSTRRERVFLRAWRSLVVEPHGEQRLAKASGAATPCAVLDVPCPVCEIASASSVHEHRVRCAEKANCRMRLVIKPFFDSLQSCHMSTCCICKSMHCIFC